MPSSQGMYAEILRRDLVAFLHRAFLELNPGTPYNYNWHIEILAAKLMDVWSGHTKRLIVNLPPRHLKSFFISVVFPAWWLGHDPTKQILTISYAQDLADKLARDSRTLMLSQLYQSMFKTRLSRDRNTVSDFETTDRGFRYATSVGGVLTGRGASLIIIDDPMKADEALSEVRRKGLNDWFDNTARSRLNNQETDAIILVTQRLHLDDLPAHVQKHEKWDVLSLPAIATRDERFDLMTPYGRFVHDWKSGTPLQPGLVSLTTLETLRRSMTDYNFAAQYQQDPHPLSGNLVKRDWLKFEPRNVFPKRFDYILQSWDTAYKESEMADFSVCTTWGVTPDHAYLLHVYRGQLAFPGLKKKAKELAAEFKPYKIIIEAHASGVSLEQELKIDDIYNVEARRPAPGDKTMRLDAQTYKFSSCYVILPDDASWLDAYVAELVSFPASGYADQVDSTTLALEWISERRGTPALTRHYQMEAEAKSKASKEFIRIKGNFKGNLLEGMSFDPVRGHVPRSVLINDDGTFLVTREEAAPLLKTGAWWIVADTKSDSGK